MDGLSADTALPAPHGGVQIFPNLVTDTDIVLPSVSSIAATIENVSAYYGKTQALIDVSFDIQKNGATAIIGPSGCGKSTLIRCVNRMNDMTADFRMNGSIKIDGVDINSKEVDPTVLRKLVGMVFQVPNPFPMSIYDNIAFGPRIHGIKKRDELDALVEGSLIKAGLWEEVKDILRKSANELSGGQKQRLCIARTLAVDPYIILMDEPTSSLDPIACSVIEETIRELKKEKTILINTHNMEQAKRISDKTAFFYLGKLIEYGETEQIFESPNNEKTKSYVKGEFG